MTPIDILDNIKTLSEHYDVTENENQGGNSHTFFAVNKITHANRLIKFYYWGNDDKYHFEPRILEKINSQNVVSIFEAGYCGEEYSYFMTDLCDGGSVDNLDYSSISTYKYLEVISGILSGLASIHASGHVHRDIKPGNVFMHGTTAKIGDFGSIARIPDGKDEVSASQHAMLYRPPESIGTNLYTKLGDIYQCGLVLYQLAGGYLPYEEKHWLSPKEKKQYDMKGYPDNTIYADQCLSARIKKGNIINLDTVNSWISDEIRKIIRKACNTDLTKRFSTSDRFLAKVIDLRNKLPNWEWEDGHLCIKGRVDYRIVQGDNLTVQKRAAGGVWRNDSRFVGHSVEELCKNVAKYWKRK